MSKPDSKGRGGAAPAKPSNEQKVAEMKTGESQVLSRQAQKALEELNREQRRRERARTRSSEGRLSTGKPMFVPELVGSRIRGRRATGRSGG
jgi:hypothetical protein